MKAVFEMYIIKIVRQCQSSFSQKQSMNLDLNYNEKQMYKRKVYFLLSYHN